MHSEELKKIIQNLKIWQRGDQRAPHKPLLLLYALSRLNRGESRLMAYAEVKEDLKKLLMEFGPYRRTYSPSYPFIRLTNDGIWGMKFQVAENAHGTHGMEKWLMRYHRQEIRKPQRPEYYTQDKFAGLHVREEFCGPARYHF